MRDRGDQHARRIGRVSALVVGGIEYQLSVVLAPFALTNVPQPEVCQKETGEEKSVSLIAALPVIATPFVLIIDKDVAMSKTTYQLSTLDK